MLNKYFLKLLILVSAILMHASFSIAQHEHHAKHNMIMLGGDEIFISHIVYKIPHNFQVILKIRLNKAAMSKYLDAREENPENLMILLLDQMDISQIASMNTLTGTILSEDKNGSRQEIYKNVTIDKSNFEIIFFEELPLNLGH